MIGVISRGLKKAVVAEFFELFKTPWEFYREGRSYEVLVSDIGELPSLDVRCFIIFGNKISNFDRKENIKIDSGFNAAILKFKDKEFSIYGECLSFASSQKIILKELSGNRVAGIEFRRGGKTVYRIGYDLFGEIEFLLSSGQPPDFSEVPTLEIHISVLRQLILNAGIPVVEIPPAPAGIDYFACLTHDVDFVRIRDHFFDHTFFGFLYRALIGSLINFYTNRISWEKLRENWIAAFKLPLVFLGLSRDFWLQFERYLEIENGLKATYFLMPFKNYPGANDNDIVSRKRAGSYEPANILPEIKQLLSYGHEVALHGIDAWKDPVKGVMESERIFDVTGETVSGVRMHWLYINENSPDILKRAGFQYDSTYGYNDAAGFKAGTTQVYSPINSVDFYELPLNIQDTALFFPGKMNLTEDSAWKLVLEIKEKLHEYGGVLTINWHQRSLAPERLWGDFYVNLVNNLKACKIYFGTAREIVGWFKKRREAVFEKAQVKNGRVSVSVNTPSDHGPDLVLQVHSPENKIKQVRNAKHEPVEISFSDRLEQEILF